MNDRTDRHAIAQQGQRLKKHTYRHPAVIGVMLFFVYAITAFILMLSSEATFVYGLLMFVFALPLGMFLLILWRYYDYKTGR